jgi:hypothetical protein
MWEDISGQAFSGFPEPLSKNFRRVGEKCPSHVKFFEKSSGEMLFEGKHLPGDRYLLTC